MKIKPEHYKILEDAITPRASKENLEEYRGRGLTAERWRWDLLNSSTINGKASAYFLVEVLYKYMNDAHIDSALRAITRTE